MPDFGPLRGAIERLVELMQERTAPEAQRLLPPMQESRGQLIIPPHAQMPSGLQVQAPPQVPLPSDVADPSRRQFFKTTAARVLSSPVLQSRFALSPIARFLMEDQARQSVSAQDAVQRVGAALPGAWRGIPFIQAPSLKDIRTMVMNPDDPTYRNYATEFNSNFNRPAYPKYYGLSLEELIRAIHKDAGEQFNEFGPTYSMFGAGKNPDAPDILYSRLEKATHLDPKTIEAILPNSDIYHAAALSKDDIPHSASDLSEMGLTSSSAAPWRQLFLDPSGSSNFAWDNVASQNDPLRRSLIGPQLIESQLPGYFGQHAKLWPKYQDWVKKNFPTDFSDSGYDDPLSYLRDQLKFSSPESSNPDLDTDAIWRILNNTK